MFAYFVNNDLLDDGKNMPYIPRYNTQNTVNAKQSVKPTFQVYLWCSLNHHCIFNGLLHCIVLICTVILFISLTIILHITTGDEDGS